MIEKIVSEIMLKSGEAVTITYGIKNGGWGPWKAECGTTVMCGVRSERPIPPEAPEC